MIRRGATPLLDSTGPRRKNWPRRTLAPRVANTLDDHES
jgi:hypothetical protein